MTSVHDPVTADRLARRGRATVLVLWGVTVASAVALFVLEATTTAPADDLTLWTRLADAWESLLLAAVGMIGGTALFTGLGWTRWAVAAAFGAGAVWNVLRPDAAGALPFLIGVSVIWAASAAILGAWRGVATFQARQLEANYERLLGPLQDLDDARRWLATAHRWAEAGAVTRGVRSRMARVMASRMAELRLPPSELDESITALGTIPFRNPLRTQWAFAKRLYGWLSRLRTRRSASPPT